MKLAHVFWSLTFGGIETMLVNIANEQARMGNEVTILLINDFYEQALIDRLSKGVQLLCMGRRRKSRSPLFLYRLNRALTALKPDVVHLHGSGLYGFLMSKKLRRVACCTLHALPHGALRRRGVMGKLLLWDALKPSGNVCLIDQVPQVFAISQAVHDELLANYGVESIVVSNGIAVSNFRRRPTQALRETFSIVQVSRLDHEKKGQDLLLEAVALLGDASVRVDFIGDGESMEYLKKLAQSLGIAERVRFLSKQTQEYISQHLCDYDLFIQPSRYEGFGLTVAEAMAACLPVAVSAGQGPAEVCCGNTYGWLFSNGSSEELSEKIKYVREHYPTALEKAEKGREYVLENYDVALTARRYLALYSPHN